MSRYAKRLAEILAGLILIYWSWKLIYPIETFEFKLVEQFEFNWIAVALISRIIISIIAFAGLWAIFGLLKLSRLYRLSFLFCLSLGTFDVMWKLVNEESIMRLCYGCPINSILWFNILVLLFLWATFIFIGMSDDIIVRNPKKWRKLLVPMSLPLILTLTYILNPIFSQDLTFNNGEPLLETHSRIPSVLDVDLNNTLLCCFSVECRHCKYAAQKIKVSQKIDEDYPKVFVLFLGDEERVGEFEDFTNTNFEYEILEGDSFFNVSGNRLPSIIHYVEDKPKAFWAGRGISYGVLDYFCKYE
ncbi:MAG: hypothetical protein MRY83_01825 [Flavobacteriales bacterium]|nr:hypothetical protein [Flavobacteriales bacterium]